VNAGSGGATKESLTWSVPFREGLRDMTAKHVATLGKTPVEALLASLFDLMATHGGNVLDGASRLRIDLEWPNDVPPASREYLRAQLLAEMQRQIVEILAAQTNALIAFQHRSFETIFHELASAASQSARKGSRKAN